MFPKKNIAKPISPKFIYLIFSLVFIIFFWLINLVTLPQISNLTLTNLTTGQTQNTFASFYQENEGVVQKNTNFRFTGTINRPLLSQKYVKITTDDCLLSLKINDQNVDLKAFLPPNSVQSDGRYCNNSQGIHVPILDFLTAPTNKIEVEVQNYDGYVGFLWNNSFYDLRFLSLLFLINIGWIGVFYQVFGWLKFSPKVGFWLAFLVVESLFVRQIFLMKFDFYDYQYDLLGTGHLGYIKYMAENWTVPDPKSGWQFYQPPFYYILAGLVWFVAKMGQFYNFFVVQQWLNISIFTTFLITGILILRRFLTGKWFFFGVALLIFWPAGVLHSVRITNDVLYYLFSGFVIFFLQKWYGQHLENRMENKEVLTSEMSENNFPRELNLENQKVETNLEADKEADKLRDKMENHKNSNWKKNIWQILTSPFWLACLMAGLSLNAKSNGLVNFAVIGAVWLVAELENIVKFLKKYKIENGTVWHGILVKNDEKIDRSVKSDSEVLKENENSGSMAKSNTENELTKENSQKIAKNQAEIENQTTTENQLETQPKNTILTKFWSQIKNYHWQKPLAQLMCLLVIFSFSFGVSFAKKLEIHWKNPEIDWLVSSEDGLNQRLFVGNKINNFLYFDPETYFNVPYNNPWTDESGRQYYWNYFLKSMVVGEFSLRGFNATNLIHILNLITLIFWLILVGYFLTSSWSELRKNAVLWLSFGLFMAGSIYYRSKTPCGCNQDLRFVLPVIIPFVALLTLAFAKINTNLIRKKWLVLRFALHIIIFIFIFSSIAIWLF